jgi:hypothetical protein
MTLLAAWWGMGYAALLVATITFGWYVVRRYELLKESAALDTVKVFKEIQAAGLTGQILIVISALALWTGLLSRAIKGHGWPFVSSADAAIGIALLMLSIYLGWELLSRDRGTGFAVTTIALLLLSYGLSQLPQSLMTRPLMSKGMLLSASLNLCGGSLLALAAAISLATLARSRYVPHTPDSDDSPKEARHDPSETLVRAALVCLAVSLAIDTWWLQKVGLGGSNDAQQAGIAIVWMIYFVALRLRASTHWRGWPWTAILAVGFVCTLPILINVPWLDSTLPI